LGVFYTFVYQSCTTNTFTISKKFGKLPRIIHFLPHSIHFCICLFAVILHYNFTNQKMRKIANRPNETQTPYICADLNKCTACLACVRVCPQQIIEKAGSFWDKYIIFKDNEKCTGCKKCIKTCRRGVFFENPNHK
jgi:Dissimilatory sulfite reductase (desulfoviridin), alpha and beta subunits